MLKMPEDIKRMLSEWVEKQRGSNERIDMPKELKDYLEREKTIIEKAEANGCMIG